MGGREGVLSVWAASVESVALHSTMVTRIQMYVLVAVLVSMVRADTTDTDSKDSASARLLDGYGAPYAPPQQYQPQPQYDSYSAPSPPVQYQASAPAPSYAYDSQPKYNEDYYKHEHHHYYHAGPPRVYKVPVPVTVKPHVVHVPQNVPVKFVGVNVPVPPPVQYVPQPIEVTPQFGGVYHHTGDYEDPYVKRKELIKSGLLLGAGVIKGALITTLIHSATDNNN